VQLTHEQLRERMQEQYGQRMQLGQEHEQFREKMQQLAQEQYDHQVQQLRCNPEKQCQLNTRTLFQSQQHQGQAQRGQSVTSTEQYATQHALHITQQIPELDLVVSDATGVRKARVQIEQLYQQLAQQSQQAKFVELLEAVQLAQQMNQQAASQELCGQQMQLAQQMRLMHEQYALQNALRVTQQTPQRTPQQMPRPNPKQVAPQQMTKRMSQLMRQSMQTVPGRIIDGNGFGAQQSLPFRKAKVLREYVVGEKCMHDIVRVNPTGS